MILRDDNRSIEQTWNMKKWYSFYTSYEDFGDAVNALSGQMDISSLKLQQVAAEKFRRRHQKFHFRYTKEEGFANTILEEVARDYISRLNMELDSVFGGLEELNSLGSDAD